MNVYLHGYVAMSATLAYIALALMVLGWLRIFSPAPKDAKGKSPTPAQLRKRRDAVADAHMDYIKFTGALWVAMSLIYPATIGLVTLFRLS